MMRWTWWTECRQTFPIPGFFFNLIVTISQNTPQMVWINVMNIGTYTNVEWFTIYLLCFLVCFLLFDLVWINSALSVDNSDSTSSMIGSLFAFAASFSSSSCIKVWNFLTTSHLHVSTMGTFLQCKEQPSVQDSEIWRYGWFRLVLRHLNQGSGNMDCHRRNYLIWSQCFSRRLEDQCGNM